MTKIKIKPNIYSLMF